MSIVGSSTGVRWVGNTLRVMGMEYLEKLSHQNVRLHNLSPNALTNLIIAGEVPLALTITNTNITLAKNKGAPVE